MSMTQTRMQALGLEFVPRAKLPASSCAYKTVGNILYIGEVSSLDGRPDGARGRVGMELDTEAGRREANAAGERLAAMILTACGEERIAQVLRVRVIICCAKGHTDLNTIADGVSDALTNAFGARGRHARTVIGASVLEAGAPVVCCAEVEMRDAHV